MPCVGLVVFLGCFTCVVVPDSDSQRDKASLSQGALPTIVVDAGHGGHDDGAVSHGLREKDLTLDVALRLEKMLRSANFPVVLTRRDDVYVSLADRAQIANKIDNAMFVSIHFNQSSESSAMGAETYYADQKVMPEYAWMWMGLFTRPKMPQLDNGESLASFIQTSMVMKLDVPNRGIKSRSLYVVRNVRDPSVLVEGGFISNPLEAQLLTNEDYRQRLAGAIAEGIVNYQRIQPLPSRPKLASLNDPVTAN